MVCVGPGAGGGGGGGGVQVVSMSKCTCVCMSMYTCTTSSHSQNFFTEDTWILHPPCLGEACCRGNRPALCDGEIPNHAHLRELDARLTVKVIIRSYCCLQIPEILIV